MLRGPTTALQIQLHASPMSLLAILNAKSLVPASMQMSNTYKTSKKTSIGKSLKIWPSSFMSISIAMLTTFSTTHPREPWVSKTESSRLYFLSFQHLERSSLLCTWSKSTLTRPHTTRLRRTRRSRWRPSLASSEAPWGSSLDSLSSVESRSYTSFSGYSTMAPLFSLKDKKTLLVHFYKALTFLIFRFLTSRKIGRCVSRIWNSLPWKSIEEDCQKN